VPSRGPPPRQRWAPVRRSAEPERLRAATAELPSERPGPWVPGSRHRLPRRLRPPPRPRALRRSVQERELAAAQPPGSSRQEEVRRPEAERTAARHPVARSRELEWPARPRQEEVRRPEARAPASGQEQAPVAGHRPAVRLPEEPGRRPPLLRLRQPRPAGHTRAARRTRAAEERARAAGARTRAAEERARAAGALHMPAAEERAQAAGALHMPAAEERAQAAGALHMPAAEERARAAEARTPAAEERARAAGALHMPAAEERVRAAAAARTPAAEERVRPAAAAALVRVRTWAEEEAAGRGRPGPALARGIPRARRRAGMPRPAGRSGCGARSRGALLSDSGRRPSDGPGERDIHPSGAHEIPDAVPRPGGL